MAQGRNVRQVVEIQAHIHELSSASEGADVRQCVVTNLQHLHVGQVLESSERSKAIYVEVENKPIKLRDLYEPFVVNGLVTVFSKSHDLVTNPTAFSAIQDDPSSPSLEDLQSRGVSLTTSAISGYKILLESVEDFVWE